MAVRLDGGAAGLLELPLEPGRHQVELVPDRRMPVSYQVVGSFWTTAPPRSSGSPLGISVSYDRTELESGDTVQAVVRRRNSASSEIPMVMADLGVPPGFTVLTRDLEGQVERCERTGRQLILYLRGVPPGELTLRYRLKARFPVRAQSPSATAYEDYNPSSRAEVPGVEFVVR